MLWIRESWGFSPVVLRGGTTRTTVSQTNATFVHPRSTIRTLDVVLGQYLSPFNSSSTVIMRITADQYLIVPKMFSIFLKFCHFYFQRRSLFHSFKNHSTFFFIECGKSSFRTSFALIKGFSEILIQL